MALSDKLKKARVDANLSQAEMAEKLGLNVRTYGSYERGERDVSTALLRNICQILNISSDELLDTRQPKPADTLTVLPQDKIHMIPVFGSVAAGFGAYASHYDNKNMYKFSSWICASIQNYEFAQKLFSKLLTLRKVCVII